MRNAPPRKWLDSLLLVIVNLLWAAQYPAYKIAGDAMEPGTLNFWTFLFATLSLLPFFFLSKKERVRRVPPGSAGKACYQFFLMGLLGIVPPSVLLAWGISHSSASNAAILSLSIPLMMTLMGALLLHERITALRLGTLALGLFGTLLVSVNDLHSATLSRSLLLGNVAVLLAGAGSAFYNAYGKDLLQRFSELEVLVYSYISGGLLCGLYSILFEGRPFYLISGYSSAVWISVLVLGLLSWGVAMVLWMWVLNRLDVGQISVSVYLLPFFGLLFSVFTVHEHLRIMQLLGGGLVIVSTLTLTAFDKPQLTERSDCETGVSKAHG